MPKSTRSQFERVAFGTQANMKTPREQGAEARRRDGDGIHEQVLPNPHQNAQDRFEWYQGYAEEDERRAKTQYIRI